MKLSLHLLLLAGLAGAGIEDAAAQTELYRPQFHFTPARNWMNDPNGLVYYQGEYHLFFQHNPSGINQANLSWGHAVSRDLVRWEELPVALTPNNGVLVFSGSAVVDWNNTSGFKTGSEPPMVAIYTGAAATQDQRLAYSNDRGRTWTQYAGNPVIPTFGDPDFRDPKVFWHAETGRWIMVVSVSTKKKLRLYGSANLKTWSLLSEFAPPAPFGSIWECPDLFKLPVTGEGTSKWVLTSSVYGGAPSGTWGYQYYIGNFDGTTFTPEVPAPRTPQDDVVLNDFESSTYGGWTTTGTAFGTGPASGNIGSQSGVGGYQGAKLVNTFFGASDAPVGTLTSPPFQLDKPFINFLIGGGGIAGQTCINLLVDGTVVRTATGDNNEALVWKHWNVSQYLGAIVRIQIVDAATGGWGHVNVDQITLSTSIIGDQNAGGGRWAEYGPDNYAPNSWGDIPASDGRRIWIGWMASIEYLNAVPTTPWRGSHSVPRELGLRRTPQGLRLTQRPVEELKSLRGRNLHHDAAGVADTNTWLATQDVPKLFDCEVELATGNGGSAGLVLGNQTQKTIVTWDRGAATLTVDRTASGNVSFSTSFPKVFAAPLTTTGGTLKLRLMMDSDTLEIFAEDGAAVLSSLVFPDAATRGLSFFGSAGAQVSALDVWEMGSRYPVAAYSNSSLMGHWAFDEATPGTYADSSGHGNNMTRISAPAPAVVPGVAGNAVEIRRNASPAQVTALAVPTSASLLNDSFTVSYFFNPKAADSKLPQVHWTSPSGLGWGFEILANGQMNFYVFAAGTANDVQSVATLPFEAYDESGGNADNLDNDPTWHHVAASYDAATGKLTLWLDGVKSEKTATGLSGRPNYGTIGDGGGLRIDTGLTIYDELRIYKGVLADPDIVELRNHPTTATVGSGPPPATGKVDVSRYGGSTFVSWPANTGLALWTSPDLSPGSWTKVAGSETLTSYATVTATESRRFYCLGSP